MSKYAVFDSDGLCQGITDLDDLPEGSAAIELVPDDADPNTLWWDGVDVLERVDFDPGLPVTALVGDTLSITLPADSVLKIDGVVIGTTPGTYPIDTTTPGLQYIEILKASRYAGPLEIIDTDENEKRTGRAAMMAHQIANATPQQIDNYIDNNVTDLESAKTVMKLIAKIAILGFKN